MRGKLCLFVTQFFQNWITPAGAGKTLATSAVKNYAKDHPRRCGENRVTSALLCMPRGSPPQVRGKRRHDERTGSSRRITPAGAGKTPVADTRRGGHGDHPRRCGENAATVASAFADAGSPPQVRGKLDAGFNKLIGKGITPAGAGKTCSARHRAGQNRDHPRRCGENVVKTENKIVVPGSPPQVRGKRRIPDIRAAFHRITPAGAGKTARC